MKLFFNNGKYMKNPIKSKYLILKRKYDQKAIAKEVGITHCYLSQIFNGRKASPEVINKINQVLDKLIG